MPQVQAFRRNVLGICDNSVKERTSSEQRNLLYLFPPNLSSAGAVDEIDGIEIIEVEVNFSTTDGRGLKTVLKVLHKLLINIFSSLLTHIYSLFRLILVVVHRK